MAMKRERILIEVLMKLFPANVTHAGDDATIRSARPGAPDER